MHDQVVPGTIHALESLSTRKPGGLFGYEANNYIPNPTIIERTGRGERHYDIWSRLLEDRIVFLGTPINDTVANFIIGQLLFLEKADRNRVTCTSTSTAPAARISAGPRDLRHAPVHLLPRRDRLPRQRGEHGRGAPRRR